MPEIEDQIKRALDRLGIAELNEMQRATIAAAGESENLALISPTGTGKTLAFLLPVLQRLDPALQTTQAMIIVPSRELALQIDQVFRKLGTSLKVTCCYGGHLRETEENNLVQPPALIIGTPGRLADHLRRGNITNNSIQTLVLDEFDKSLELGFQDEIEFIVSKMPAVHRRILTSATDMQSVPPFLGFKDPVRLNFSKADDESPDKLWIRTLRSPDKDKIETLYQLLCFTANRPSIVFCNHREAVERTSAALKDKSIVNVFYHGALEQNERDSALAKFRNGTANVLVTTDLASRGLDIPGIRYIIHYHLPGTDEIFTHRNGRTARMEASGTVVVLLAPDETMPSYITEGVEDLSLPAEASPPEKPKWTTLFISAGKKDKVNKVDIVGFLSHRGELKQEDIGLIEVKDFFSFVAIRKSKASHTLHLIKDQRLKNKKLKIDIAK